MFLILHTKENCQIKHVMILWRFKIEEKFNVYNYVWRLLLRCQYGLVALINILQAIHKRKSNINQLKNIEVKWEMGTRQGTNNSFDSGHARLIYWLIDWCQTPLKTLLCYFMAVCIYGWGSKSPRKKNPPIFGMKTDSSSQLGLESSATARAESKNTILQF